MAENNPGDGRRFERHREPIRDTRPEAARQDYEQRKRDMLRLAEERGCLPMMQLMLKLADIQSGFSDEQALFDYNRRESEQRGKGERTDTSETFKSYSRHGSDWLRSLEALSAAMTTEEGVPGLLEVASLEIDEGRKFEAWCQKNFLNAQTLVDIINNLRSDRSFNLAALQSIPYRKLGRIILETHLDRLMVETNDLSGPKKGYLPLPVDGFSEPPREVIRLAPRSAGKDALNSYLLVGTYIEEKEEREKASTKLTPGQAPPPPKKVYYAHGVHVAPVDDLKRLCPRLFTGYGPNPYDLKLAQPHTDQNTGALVRTMMVQIRGWEIGGIADNRYQDVEVLDEEVLHVLVDNAIMGEKAYFPFHGKNKNLISPENAEALYQRSAGRVRQGTVTGFDLRAWYLNKISKLGTITSATQLKSFEHVLTLTLGDIIGPDLAKSLTEHYPERINFGKNSVGIEYAYMPELQKHDATVTLGANNPERAEALVTLLPNAMPRLGEEGQSPLNVSFVVIPQQVDDHAQRMIQNSRWGTSTESNRYPSKTFTELNSALDYLEDARIAYAMEHIEKGHQWIFTSAEHVEWGSLVYMEISFSLGAKFPDAKAIAATAEPIAPIATRRNGEKIMPYPAIVFRKSGSPSYPDYFGLIFLTKEEDANKVEEKSRKAWQEMGGIF